MRSESGTVIVRVGTTVRFANHTRWTPSSVFDLSFRVRTPAVVPPFVPPFAFSYDKMLSLVKKVVTGTTPMGRRAPVPSRLMSQGPPPPEGSLEAKVRHYLPKDYQVR